MGEDNIDKDSFHALFETMPPEHLNQQQRDFPLNEPLSSEERGRVTEWLLKPAPEGGGVSVKLYGPYDNESIRSSLIESMLLNSWFLPSLELGNRIPLQGSSAHHVGSTTIPLSIGDEATRKIDVVIKPFNSNRMKADAELRKLKEVRRRSIAAVEPLGVLGIDDSMGHETYILTVLKKGIVPLQKINFEELHTDSDNRFRQLKDLLASLAVFVARMHNEGVVHNDLYLRNIAADLSQETSEEFIVFDLEGSNMLKPDKLALKRKTGTNKGAAFEKGFEEFETSAIKDVASLTADIAARNEHIDYDTIFHNFFLNYLRAREPSRGMFDEDEYIRIFDREYKSRLSKTKRAVEMTRRHPLELITTLKK